MALSFPGHDEIFSGRESTLLYDLDTRLRELPAGVLTTWNGSAGGPGGLTPNSKLPFVRRLA